jgi:hypothetical protein
MFDQAAAQRAAQQVIAAAPVIEGGSGNEIAINVKELVAAIIAAGNPDAAIVPAYDHTTAMSAWHRLEIPEHGTQGAKLNARAHKGSVAIVIYDGDGRRVVNGFIGPEFAWHLGMALCSASQESARLNNMAEVQS